MLTQVASYSSPATTFWEPKLIEPIVTRQQEISIFLENDDIPTLNLSKLSLTGKCRYKIYHKGAVVGVINAQNGEINIDTYKNLPSLKLAGGINVEHFIINAEGSLRCDCNIKARGRVAINCKDLQIEKDITAQRVIVNADSMVNQSTVTAEIAKLMAVNTIKNVGTIYAEASAKLSAALVQHEGKFSSGGSAKINCEKLTTSPGSLIDAAKSFRFIGESLDNAGTMQLQGMAMLSSQEINNQGIINLPEQGFVHAAKLNLKEYGRLDWACQASYGDQQLRKITVDDAVVIDQGAEVLLGSVSLQAEHLTLLGKLGASSSTLAINEGIIEGGEASLESSDFSVKRGMLTHQEGILSLSEGSSFTAKALYAEQGGRVFFDSSRVAVELVRNEGYLTASSNAHIAAQYFSNFGQASFDASHIDIEEQYLQQGEETETYLHQSAKLNAKNIKAQGLLQSESSEIASDLFDLEGSLILNKSNMSADSLLARANSHITTQQSALTVDEMAQIQGIIHASSGSKIKADVLTTAGSATIEGLSDVNARKIIARRDFTVAESYVDAKELHLFNVAKFNDASVTTTSLFAHPGSSSAFDGSEVHAAHTFTAAASTQRFGDSDFSTDTAFLDGAMTLHNRSNAEVNDLFEKQGKLKATRDSKITVKHAIATEKEAQLLVEGAEIDAKTALAYLSGEVKLEDSRGAFQTLSLNGKTHVTRSAVAVEETLIMSSGDKIIDNKSQVKAQNILSDAKLEIADGASLEAREDIVATKDVSLKNQASINAGKKIKTFGKTSLEKSRMHAADIEVFEELKLRASLVEAKQKLTLRTASHVDAKEQSQLKGTDVDCSGRLEIQNSDVEAEHKLCLAHGAHVTSDTATFKADEIESQPLSCVDGKSVKFKAGSFEAGGDVAVSDKLEIDVDWLTYTGNLNGGKSVSIDVNRVMTGFGGSIEGDTTKINAVAVASIVSSIKGRDSLAINSLTHFNLGSVYRSYNMSVNHVLGVDYGLNLPCLPTGSSAIFSWRHAISAGRIIASNLVPRITGTISLATQASTMLHGKYQQYQEWNKTESNKEKTWQDFLKDQLLHEKYQQYQEWKKAESNKEKTWQDFLKDQCKDMGLKDIMPTILTAKSLYTSVTNIVDTSSRLPSEWQGLTWGGLAQGAKDFSWKTAARSVLTSVGPTITKDSGVAIGGGATFSASVMQSDWYSYGSGLDAGLFSYTHAGHYINNSGVILGSQINMSGETLEHTGFMANAYGSMNLDFSTLHCGSSGYIRGEDARIIADILRDEGSLELKRGSLEVRKQLEVAAGAELHAKDVKAKLAAVKVAGQAEFVKEQSTSTAKETPPSNAPVSTSEAVSAEMQQVPASTEQNAAAAATSRFDFEADQVQLEGAGRLRIEGQQAQIAGELSAADKSAVEIVRSTLTAGSIHCGSSGYLRGEDARIIADILRDEGFLELERGSLEVRKQLEVAAGSELHAKDVKAKLAAVKVAGQAEFVKEQSTSTAKETPPSNAPVSTSETVSAEMQQVPASTEQNAAAAATSRFDFEADQVQLEGAGRLRIEGQQAQIAGELSAADKSAVEIVRSTLTAGSIHLRDSSHATAASSTVESKTALNIDRQAGLTANKTDVTAENAKIKGALTMDAEGEQHRLQIKNKLSIEGTANTTNVIVSAAELEVAGGKAKFEKKLPPAQEPQAVSESTANPSNTTEINSAVAQSEPAAATEQNTVVPESEAKEKSAVSEPATPDLSTENIRVTDGGNLELVNFHTAVKGQVAVDASSGVGVSGGQLTAANITSAGRTNLKETTVHATESFDLKPTSQGSIEQTQVISDKTLHLSGQHTLSDVVMQGQQVAVDQATLTIQEGAGNGVTFYAQADLNFNAQAQLESQLNLVSKDRMALGEHTQIDGEKGRVALQAERGSLQGHIHTQTLGVAINEVRDAASLVAGTGQYADMQAQQFTYQTNQGLVLDKEGTRTGQVAVIASQIAVTRAQKSAESLHLETTEGDLKVQADMAAKQDITLISARNIETAAVKIRAEHDMTMQARQSCHIQGSEVTAGHDAVVHAIEGEVRNTGGDIQGGNYLEVYGKKGIVAEATEKDIQTKHGIRKEWRPATMTGGNGEGQEGIGARFITEGKMILDASIAGSKGKLEIQADQGFESKARTHVALVSEKTKRSGFLKHKKTVERVYETQVAASGLYAADDMSIRCKEGGMHSVATNFMTPGSIKFDVRDKMTLLDLITTRREERKESGLWGLTSHRRTSSDDSCLPTRVVTLKNAEMISRQNDVEMRGVVVSAQKIRVEAENILVSVSKLNHTYSSRTSGLSVAVMGQTAFSSHAPAGSEKNTAPFSGINDPAIAHLKQLAASKGGAETALNAANAAVELAETANAALQGGRNGTLVDEALRRYGVGDVSPDIAVTVGTSSEKGSCQTKGEGNMTADVIELKGRGNVTLEGVDVHAEEKIRVKATEFEQRGIELERHHKSKSQSVKVGFEPTAAPTGAVVGASVSQSEIHRKDWQNQQTTSNGTLEVDVERWQMDGANASARSVTGDVREKMTIITHTSTEKSKHDSMTLGSDGNVQLSYSRSDSKTVTEVAGLHTRESIDGKKFRVKHLDSEGGAVTSDGKVDAFAETVTAKEVKEFKKARGWRVSSNVRDLLPTTADVSGQLLTVQDHAAKRTMLPVNCTKENYRARHTAVIHGKEGTELSDAQVQGQLKTSSANGRRVIKDERHDYRVEVPIYSKAAMEQMRDNFSWAFSRDYQPRSLQDSIMAHEQFTSAAEVEAYVDKVKTMAALSEAVYADETAAGFAIVNQYDDPATDAKVIAYKNSENNQLVIAFQGTASLKMIANDDKDIAFGDRPRSYNEKMQSFIRQTLQEHADAKAYFTGHSLGAAEASLAANQFGKPAYVFDNPGIRNNKGKYDFSQVTSFQSGDNIVNGSNNDKGKQIQLTPTPRTKIITEASKYGGAAGVLVGTSYGHQLSQINAALNRHLDLQLNKAQESERNRQLRQRKEPKKKPSFFNEWHGASNRIQKENQQEIQPTADHPKVAP